MQSTYSCGRVCSGRWPCKQLLRAVPRTRLSSCYPDTRFTVPARTRSILQPIRCMFGQQTSTMPEERQQSRTSSGSYSRMQQYAEQLYASRLEAYVGPVAVFVTPGRVYKPHPLLLGILRFGISTAATLFIANLHQVSTCCCFISISQNFDSDSCQPQPLDGLELLMAQTHNVLHRHQHQQFQAPIRHLLVPLRPPGNNPSINNPS